MRASVFLGLVIMLGGIQSGLTGSEGTATETASGTSVLSREQIGAGVTLATLSNGMTVILRENHAAPLATVRAYVHNTGSCYEGNYLGAGISHLVEHLVAGGSTTRRNETEIRDLIDTLGGQSNAYTSHDVTAYYIDCPASGVELAIDLIADNLQDSTIPDKEFRRELGVVTRELEMGESERERVQYQAMAQLLFQDHPIRHPIIGYLPVLHSLHRDDVVTFYKRQYVPQNIVFVVVGDIDPDETLAMIVRNVSNFRRTAEREPVLPVEREQASPRSSRREMEGTTTIVSLAWPTVPLQHPDLYPLDVASYILTNGDSSRLMRRLKIDQPLAIAVNSASYTPGFVKGWFEVSAECEPANAETVEAILLEEVAKLRTEPVRAEELAKAKRQKAAEHVFSQETVQAQAEALAGSFRATGDPLFDDQYVAGIQGVTAEQIQEVAERYFLPHRLNRVTIEPLGSASQVAADGQSPSERQQVHRRVLPNGLTLLVKRDPILPMVAFQAYVRAGSVSDLPEQAGLASLATTLMMRGTKSYSGDAIAEYFDSIGGSATVDSQRNSSFLQAAMLSDDFDRSLPYLKEILFAPTFDEAEFTKRREIQLSQIASRSANPQTEIMDYWALQLPPSSPFSHTILGTADTVGRLTAADCRAFHQRFFVPNNMVIAVYGDVDPEAALDQLAREFGAFPKSVSFTWPEFLKLATPMTSDVVAHLTNQKANTAMVVLSYPISSVFEEGERNTLEMLNAILTGTGGTGRLFEELRGEQLVYYVFGMPLAGFSPGYFVLMAQTRPESREEVIERIRASIDTIAREGVPADEFNQVRDKLLAAHAMQNATARTKAFQAGIDELYGLGHDYDTRYPERLQTVTPEDVRELVRKYFKHATIVTSAPASPPAAN